MAYQISVTTFQPDERFEPKVLPPTEEDSNFAMMIHHGEKDLVSLRMTRGQLISLYKAIGSALQGGEETDVPRNGDQEQQSFFNSMNRDDKSSLSRSSK